MSSSSTLDRHIISECFIKPKYEVEESKHPYHLTPWGLSLLPLQYIQNGLLFTKPQLHDHSMRDFLERLKESLSLTLSHFYPLAGQFKIQLNQDKFLVYVDCQKGLGAKFIHVASLDTTISDILSPTYVPPVVQSFFDLNGSMNYEGLTLPLLSIQVTELLDGIFLGVSMNHSVADGASFYNFLNTWSEIHTTNNKKQILLSRPPIHTSWFECEHTHGFPIPLTYLQEFTNKCQLPQLTERIFHFSSESLQKLKEKANKDAKTHKISTLQALTALAWKSIAQANRLSYDNITSCGLAIDNRRRLDPPLPKNYFRTSIDVVKAKSTVRQVSEGSLGSVASLVHESVANHTNKVVRNSLKEWMACRPSMYGNNTLCESFNVLMTNSPRFDMYGNEFGLGKPLAIRSGPFNKFSGNLCIYQRCDEDGGGVDLEVSLPPDSMTVLESNKQFMASVSLPHMLAKKLPRLAKYLCKICISCINILQII